MKYPSEGSLEDTTGFEEGGVDRENQVYKIRGWKTYESHRPNTLGFEDDLRFDREESNKIIRSARGSIIDYLEDQGREVERKQPDKVESRIMKAEFETEDEFVKGNFRYCSPEGIVKVKPSQIFGILKFDLEKDLRQISELQNEIDGIESLMRYHLPEDSPYEWSIY